MAKARNHVVPKFRVTGDKEVMQALSQLDHNTQMKYLGQAVNAGLQPFVKEQRKIIAPRKKTGLLQKSITKKVKRYNSGFVFGVTGPDRETIGTFGKKSKKRWPNKYAHLVEYGTKAHSLGKGSSLRKKAKSGNKHPGSRGLFFRAKAYRAVAATVRRIMQSKLITAMQKDIDKLRSK